MNFKSNFLKEFQQRGFFSQTTHEKELDEKLQNGSVCAYIGFDCTAKSLHVGSLIQIMILRLLQKHGHRPIVLLGGGTTKIGDPSGKDEARKFLDENGIQENLAGIKKTLEKFISFEGPHAAILVNNDDWLKDLNYLDFLRDVGRHFSVNRMLTFDSVKLRLDRQQPLSFLEFNYMILQAYDFYKLNQEYDCALQIGGSDQWGNIVNGVELTRRIWAANEEQTKEREVFGLTSPLLTTADGKKMGKTADGAVWLDEDMLSAFDYFQYFRNCHDQDVGRFLRLFTELDLPQIEELEQLQDQEINKAKEKLAFEVVKICHGQQKADDVLKQAQEIFAKKNTAAFELKEVAFEEGKKLTAIMSEIGATASNSEAKKLIQGKAVKINGEAVLDIHHGFDAVVEFDLSVGKKKFYKVRLA